jgi:hypothetical protein
VIKLSELDAASRVDRLYVVGGDGTGDTGHIGLEVAPDGIKFHGGSVDLLHNTYGQELKSPN